MYCCQNPLWPATTITPWGEGQFFCYLKRIGSFFLASRFVLKGVFKGFIWGSHAIRPCESLKIAVSAEKSLHFSANKIYEK